MALTVQELITPGTSLLIRSSDRTDGSLRVTEPDFEANLERLWPVAAKVTWLKQIHGDSIVNVAYPGEHAGDEADGAFTAEAGFTLAVTTADCAPVVIAAADGDLKALAVVHAGWRGLLAGIVEKAARLVLESVPGGERVAFCGPCIGPGHYEFSAIDLEPLVDRYGPSVRSRTNAGSASLDLFAGVGCALSAAGFPTPDRPAHTEAPAYYSHRTGIGDRKTGRMLTLAQLLHT